MRPQLVFLHGLESGPHGSKYHALLEFDPATISPDCSGIADIGGRLEIIGKCLAGVERMVLVGSSFGGLAAALLAQDERYRGRIAGCLLCAPALSLAAPGGIATLPPRTIILHGTRDDVVPVQDSRDFSAAHGIRLVEVDDDHRLSASTGLMVELVAGLLGN